jgi:hypothetical protein
MKKEHIILLIAGGILLACLAYKAGRRNSVVSGVVIKPGDKGHEVMGLQNYLTAVTGLGFPNPGAYDKETLAAVQYYMDGTAALKDPEKGSVSKEFASDLYIVQSKIKTE